MKNPLRTFRHKMVDNKIKRQKGQIKQAQLANRLIRGGISKDPVIKRAKAAALARKRINVALKAYRTKKQKAGMAQATKPLKRKYN